MSENENPPPKQTSSIPLKKETVRVTLKAADAPAAPVIPAAPTAPRPPSLGAPPAPSVGAPTAPAPAPTIALRPAGAPSAPAPAPAPTIRIGGTTAPASPTVALRPAGAPAAAGAPTIALPKATVQLQPPTQPMGSTVAPAIIGNIQTDDDEDEGESPLTTGLAVFALLAAAAVVVIQSMIVSLYNGWDTLFS